MNEQIYKVRMIEVWYAIIAHFTNQTGRFEKSFIAKVMVVGVGGEVCGHRQVLLQRIAPWRVILYHGNIQYSCGSSR